MKHVVIIAGRTIQGPEGTGVHDDVAQARLLALCLRASLSDRIRVTLIEGDAWPRETIGSADAAVVMGDGRDGDPPFAPACQLTSWRQIADLDALCARGGGVVLVHFALFAGEADAECMLRWCGGYFSWEPNGRRDQSSKVTPARGLLDHVRPGHPILRGVGGGPLREEYPHRLVFHPDAIPLLRQRALGGAGDEQIVAWCLERLDGGRSFGTSMGHRLDSLRHDGLRTLLTNAIAWTAGVDVPPSGLGGEFVEREAVDAALGLGPGPAPIRVAVLAGNAAHRWHNWPETTAALLRAWGDDPRITARVFTDADDLVEGLGDRDVLVQNWVNWEDPTGLSEAARSSLLAFLARGGGLFVHHFANGACHASLHGALAGDWPEYRRIVRRVWEHRALGPGPSGHDAFGRFTVEPRGEHPLVTGLEAFEVEDELYWRQHGEEPITPLLTARARVTGADEPLLWAYDYGVARVVQCLLGHSAKTYDAPAMRVLARRIVAWCARRPIHGPADGP